MSTQRAVAYRSPPVSFMPRNTCMRLETRAKIWISNVIQHLDRASNETQHEVWHVLSQNFDDVKVDEVTGLWITSSPFVKGASRGFIKHVCALESVSEVRLPVVIPVEKLESTFEHVVDSVSKNHTNTHGAPVPEWGVEKVQAPQVWNAGFTGQNVTVAIIDTGVRGTHEALRDSFVGLSQNGWFDPVTNASEPSDPNGHGTHAMGTILGQKGLGVTDVHDLRKAIRELYRHEKPDILEGVVADQLRIYANRAVYEDENGQPLEEDSPIGFLGPAKRDALVVVVKAPSVLRLIAQASYSSFLEKAIEIANVMVTHDGDFELELNADNTTRRNLGDVQVQFRRPEKGSLNGWTERSASGKINN